MLIVVSYFCCFLYIFRNYNFWLLTHFLIFVYIGKVLLGCEYYFDKNIEIHSHNSPKNMGGANTTLPKFYQRSHES